MPGDQHFLSAEVDEARGSNDTGSSSISTLYNPGEKKRLRLDSRESGERG